MFRIRKMRSPGNQPSQVVLLRYPTTGGVVFPYLGKGLSPTGGKWNTARQGIFQTRLVWGREVPRREAPPVQPLGLRSDHVLNVCLRLSFHLQEAGKPEPPEASHLASPRPRSLGGPFLPPSSSTRRQHILPDGGPRGPAALIRRQQAKFYERVRPAVHVYSGVSSTCVGLCARLCAPVGVSFRVRSLFRLFARGPWTEDPSLHPNPPLPGIGKVHSGAAVCRRREFLHRRGAPTHSPSAT